LRKNAKWLEKIYYDKLMLFRRKTIVKRDKNISPDKFYKVYKISTEDQLYYMAFEKEFIRERVHRLRGLKARARILVLRKLKTRKN